MILNRLMVVNLVLLSSHVDVSIGSRAIKQIETIWLHVCKLSITHTFFLAVGGGYFLIEYRHLVDRSVKTWHR